MRAGGLPSRLRAGIPELLAQRFTIDARSLAAFRASLGAVLLVDLLLRTRYLTTFYTDGGVLPRELLRQEYSSFSQLSLHALSGDAWFQAILFVAAGVAALMLLIGYHSRLAAITSFVLVVSLHARNPLVLNAGDLLLTRLLFWSMFLPLGATWSIDSLRRPQSERVVSGLASAALLIQVVLVYSVNGVFKLRSPTWMEGETVQLVLQLDTFTVLFADLLTGYPGLLTALNYLWIALLLASPLLILLTGWPRTVLAGLFMAMHVGMLLTMDLAVFPLVSIAGLTPFIATSTWETSKVNLTQIKNALKSFGARLDAALPVIRYPELSALRRPVRRVTTVTVAVSLTVILLMNMSVLGYVDAPREAEEAVEPVKVHWSLFAPNPLRADRWYVPVAYLEGNQSVDPFQGGEVTWNEPGEAYPSARWRKYMQSLRNDEYLQNAFGDYLCRKWNTGHRDKATQLEIYYLSRWIRLDGPGDTIKTKIHDHDCGNTES